MAITILDRVKLSLRIRNSTILDSDIEDIIEAAKADMLLSGITNMYEEDPLIIQAIKYYARANFALDNNESEKFRSAYENLRDKLSLSKEYTEDE